MGESFFEFVQRRWLVYVKDTCCCHLPSSPSTVLDQGTVNLKELNYCGWYCSFWPVATTHSIDAWDYLIFVKNKVKFEAPYKVHQLVHLRLCYKQHRAR